VGYNLNAKNEDRQNERRDKKTEREAFGYHSGLIVPKLGGAAQGLCPARFWRCLPACSPLR
jgi:hypothetical protein